MACFFMTYTPYYVFQNILNLNKYVKKLEYGRNDFSCFYCAKVMICPSGVYVCVKGADCYGSQMASVTPCLRANLWRRHAHPCRSQSAGL